MGDYITEEVRNSALSIIHDCDNNLNKYYDYMKSKELESKKDGWQISTLSIETETILKEHK